MSLDTNAAKLATITTLKEVLGTMVIMPNYQSDPHNIGSKTYLGNIQQPILDGDKREIALEKLTEYIRSL